MTSIYNIFQAIIADLVSDVKSDMDSKWQNAANIVDLISDVLEEILTRKAFKREFRIHFATYLDSFVEICMRVCIVTNDSRLLRQWHEKLKELLNLDDPCSTQEVKNLRNKFSFTRGKTDHDVMLDCSKQLVLGGFGADKQVFLKSGKLVNVPPGDFLAFQTNRIGIGPDLTRAPPLSVLESSCKDLIQLKVEAFEKRIWLVAALSAIGGSTPIPGLTALVDLGHVVREVEEYKRQLGLDDEALDRLSEKYHIPKDVLVNTVDMSNTPEIITRMMAVMATEEAVDLLPALGQIAGAGVAYRTSAAVLRLALSQLRDAANKIFHLTIEASTSDLQVRPKR